MVFDRGVSGEDIDPKSVDTESISNVYYANEFAEGGDGSINSPWINGISNAIEAVPSDEFAAIFAPAGHYGQTEQIDGAKLVRERWDTVGDATRNVMMPVFGAGQWATNVYAGDGDGTFLDDDLIRIGFPDWISDDEDVIVSGIEKMLIHGLKDQGATAGSGIKWDAVTNSTGNNEFIHGIYKDLYVRQFADHGFDMSDNWVTESKIENVTINRTGSHGWLAQGGNVNRIDVSDSKFNLSENGAGIDTTMERCRIVNSEVRQNAKNGILNRGDKNQFENFTARNNDTANGGNPQIANLGNDNTIEGSIEATNSTPAVNNQGSDNQYDLKMDSWTFALNGTRPRWQDTIGGGPFGGVNLGSVSGTSEGETARSDGSATGFPNGALATWDGSQWVRADGQATVTPA